MQSRQLTVFFCALVAGSACSVHAADGDLDPSFGNGGQLLLPVDPFNEPIGATLVANDVAVQPDGKIVVAGYGTGTNTSEWIVVRLNADGSYDNTFGVSQNGIVYYYLFGPADNQAASVALRPNGKIVVGGTIFDDNNGLVTAVAIQLNADGSSDTTWGNTGAVFLTPASGDATHIRRIALDGNGSVALVGEYTHGASGNNDFYFALIAADGKGGGLPYEAVIKDASLGGTSFDSATDVAVDSQGRYVVGGFAMSAAGDVDCAAIRVLPGLPLQVDSTFGDIGFGGVARVHFNMGGDNNDFCDAMTLDPSGFMMLGGHGTKVNTGSGINYQSAITALFDNNGRLLGVGGGTPHDDTYAFTYDGQPGNGDFNTINRLLVDRYDTQRPTFMAVGHGFDGIFFPGTTQDFGLSRLNGFDGSLGTDADPGFHGGMSNRGGFSMIDYSVCGQETCSFTSNDRALSGAFDAQGRLVVVGSADDPRGGTDIAIARLKPFDGIFKNAFETPSY
jgi:uncharacterized delta-60 repeat protein